MTNYYLIIGGSGISLKIPFEGDRLRPDFAVVRGRFKGASRVVVNPSEADCYFKEFGNTEYPDPFDGNHSDTFRYEYQKPILDFDVNTPWYEYQLTLTL